MTNEKDLSQEELDELSLDDNVDDLNAPDGDEGKPTDNDDDMGDGSIDEPEETPEGDTDPEGEPEDDSDPEENPDGDTEPGDDGDIPEEDKIDLDKELSSIDTKLIVPTQPNKGEKYIKYLLDDIVSDVNEKSTIIHEYEMSIEDQDTVEPVTLTVSFIGGTDEEPQIVEKKFTVTSMLVEYISVMSELDMVVNEQPSIQYINEKYTKHFQSFDTTEGNVTVNYDIEDETLTVSYSDGTKIQEISLNIVVYDEKDQPYPPLNTDFDTKLTNVLIANDVKSTDTDSIKSHIQQLLDDNGYFTTTILQHTMTKEFLMIPIAYEWEGVSIKYNVIILRTDIDGSGFDFDNDIDDSGALPPESIGTPANRFAIGLLARERATQSFEGEVMVHQTTGQTLIKDMSGNVVSYDKLSRQKSFERFVKTEARMTGMTGSVARITPEDKVLPHTLFGGQSLIEPTQIGTGKIESIQLFVDIDTILLGLDSKLASEPSSITVSLMKDVDGLMTEETFNFNTERSPHLELNIKEENTNLWINSIYVRPHDSYNTVDTRMVLNDIIVIIKEDK